MALRKQKRASALDLENLSRDSLETDLATQWRVYQMQHTRQHMPVHGKASAATARKLIASSNKGPAQIYLERTVECEDYASEITVVPCKSKQAQMKCGVVLIPGQRYFMVRSQKFTTRWYVLTQTKNGTWICSLRDVQDRCTAQVETFIDAHRHRVA